MGLICYPISAALQANAVLPNGFPNGLLSGTGLLNGQQQSGNGTHRLW